jgi:Ankyrin repeats (3 copies)
MYKKGVGMKIYHVWIVIAALFIGAFGLVQSSFYDKDTEVASFMDPSDQAIGEQIVVDTIVDLLENQPEVQQDFIDLIKSNHYTLASIINVPFGQDGTTALHLLAQKGRVDLMQEFIYAGADVNAQDHKGWTPLHYAVLSKSPAAVALLVESGADLQLKNNSGNNPIDIAIRFDAAPEIIDYLESIQEEEQEFFDNEFSAI